MIDVTIDVPDDILDVDALIAQSVAAVNDTVDDTKKDFDKTKKTFSAEHQFEFEVKKADGIKNGFIEGWVRTDDENYCRLNEGFTIKAVAGKYMKFRPQYSAKTARGIIDAKRGGSSGNLVRRMSRRATKVEGRQFDVAVRNNNITQFYKRVLEEK